MNLKKDILFSIFLKISLCLQMNNISVKLKAN